MGSAPCFLCGDLDDRGGRIRLSDGLALAADIAPLITGHMLLHTLGHLTSFAEAAAERSDILDETIETLVAAARPRLGTLVLFEHGTNGTGPIESGCTDHAHIHVLPLPELPPSFADLGFRLDARHPSLDLARLNKLNYFWIAGPGRPMLDLAPSNPERQYLRQAVAQLLGLREYRTWDLFDIEGAVAATETWRAALAGVAL